MVSTAEITAPVSTVIEIEIDGPRNENCIFRPLQQKIRGRFDLNRIAEPQARMKSIEVPEPIPGQRLRVDLVAGKALLIEPLQLPEFERIKERYARDAAGSRCWDFAPAEKELDCDLPTMLYWMRAEVNAGTAKIVRGSFPDPLPGIPRKRFHSQERVDTAAHLVTAIDGLAKTQAATLSVLERLIEKLDSRK